MIGQRVFLFLLLPAILLLMVGVVVTQDFFGAQGVELGQDAVAVSVDNWPDTAVFVEAELFSDAADPDTLYLSLNQATIALTGSAKATDYFCLHGIYVTPELEPLAGVLYPDAPFDDQDGEVELPTFTLDPPLCNFLEATDGLIEDDSLVSDVFSNLDEPLELPLDEGTRSIRFYPFDNRAGRWEVYPLALTPAGLPRQDVAVELRLTAELADWEESIRVSTEALRFELSPTNSQVWPAEVLSIQLARTSTQRLLTLILLGFLTVLILGLFFIKGKNTLLEIVIGILLGLWGIQAVLIPNYIENRTLVHYWIIILYILLGLVTYVRLVGLPLIRVDAAEAIASFDDELEELLTEDGDEQLERDS